MPFSHVSAFFSLSSVCLHMKRREMEKRKIGALLEKKKQKMKYNEKELNKKKKAVGPGTKKQNMGMAP